jgi:hypothetical protein
MIDMDAERLRAAVGKAVTAMDEAALNRLAFMSGLRGWMDIYEGALQRAVLVAGHQVQEFWLGECRCHASTPQVKIAVGTPVTLQPEILAAMAANPDMPQPTIYPGSIVVPCEKCATPTYQGPRIQEAKETNPDLVFMCHLCGMLELAAAHDAGDLDGVTMTDLGNPYDPKPRS